MAEIRHTLTTQLADVRGVPCVPLSALTGRNVDKLLPAVVAAHARWDSRVPTGALNRWLGAALEQHPPPLAQGRRVKIRYATQTHGPPADLHPVRQQAGRRAAGQLPALSGGGPARHRSTWTACRSASTSGTARTLTTGLTEPDDLAVARAGRAAAARPTPAPPQPASGTAPGRSPG